MRSSGFWIAISFVTVLASSVSANEACANMRASRPSSGSTPGSYYILSNNCSFIALFRFTAGTFGGGLREYSPFIGPGRRTEMFIPSPGPRSYTVERR